MLDPYTTPSELGKAEQQIFALKLEIAALGECIQGYEDAIKAQQKLTIQAEKEAKKAIRQLDKLKNLVIHNAKNAKTILNQLN